MFAHNGKIALARAGGYALKNEFQRAGNIEQGEILGRRAHKNQVVVSDVVEREQASALDQNPASERPEGVIESVDGEDLSNPGVVVINSALGIVTRVVVTHAGLGSSHEGGVAEDHPRLF